MINVDTSSFLTFLVFNVLCLEFGLKKALVDRPIIQNGKFVGAVTHVLVQDSTRGYGIFIENMLEQ